MAYQTIRIKNTNVAGKKPGPVDIDVAELCVNLKDHTLFSKDTDGNIFELTGGSIGNGPTPPISDNEIGDLWWDGDVLLIWNGTDWETVAPVTSVNGVTGDVVLGINDLSDVTTNGASEGDILVLQGGVWVPVSPGSVSTDVDLGYTAASTGGIVTNTAGDDATLPLVDDTNAGLMPPDAFTKLDNLPETLEVPGDGAIVINGGDGITASGLNASANQATDTARTLSIDTTWLNNWIDTNKPAPTVGEGQITLKDSDGGSIGAFSVNQASDQDIIIPTGSGGGGGVDSASYPLKIDGSTVKLNYSKGLHVVNNNLEAYLGQGLAFDGEQIKVQFPENAVLSYEARANSTGGTDEVKWDGAGIDSPGGRQTVTFNDIPNNVDGFVTIITFKVYTRPNPDSVYPTPQAVTRMLGTFYCQASGRGAFCRTSNTSNEVALNIGDTICFGGGNGIDQQGWKHMTYSTRIDEWRCNDGNNEAVTFTFGCRDVEHNKVLLSYNGGCRVAFLPYDKGS